MKLNVEARTGCALREESASEHAGAILTRIDWGRHREAVHCTKRSRPFSQRVEACAVRFGALWEAAGSDTPRLGPRVRRDNQASRERKADERIADVDRRLRQYPDTKARREVWREDFLRTLQDMAMGCLGFPEAGLKLFFNRTAMDATRQFIRNAKAFDPTMSDGSIFQALRNLWVIHNLQLFLECDLGFSPAAFGYSMLYPWTDNYLDDPRMPESSKIAFGDWLARRLAGVCVTAPDAHAAQVSRLVGMIEECFCREEHPEVYLSLRAIHFAQMASLRQQQAGASANEQNIVAITVEKGGTSVLTDGFLVRGWLSEAEADFMFGYGVLLQLMDDLQDLRNDLANRHATIFTRLAANGPLDEVTARLWSFTQTVLWSSDHFPSPEFDPLKTLIQENCKLLLLQSVARNRDFYSGGFADELETCSPFSFAYLRRREKSFGAEYAKIAGFMRRKHGIDSVLDAMDC